MGDVARILVRGVNWVGDALLMTPALASVRRTFPQAHVSLLVRPWVADLFRGNPAVDEILRFESPVQFNGRTAFETVEVGGQTIAEGETVIVLIGGAVVFTPLGDVISERLETPHSNERRVSLYDEALRGIEGVRRFLPVPATTLLGWGLLVATDLPRAPEGKVYELWAIAAGKPHPAGLFAVDAEGRGRVRLSPLEGVSEVEAFAVTLEPQGGVPAPTGPVYLVSKPA